MQKNILDNKAVMTIIIAFAVIISIVVWQNFPTDFFNKNKKSDKNSPDLLIFENFKSKYFGMFEHNSNNEQAIMEIISVTKTQNNISFIYNFKINFVEVLKNKKGKLNIVSKKIDFSTIGAKPNEIDIINKLKNAKIEISKIKKIVIKGKNGKWKLMQM